MGSEQDGGYLAHGGGFPPATAGAGLHHPSHGHRADLRLHLRALRIYTHHLIDRTQYTELVTVVILSAFVPTLIAQQLFQPKVVDKEEEEALGAEDLVVIRPAAGPTSLTSPDPVEPS